MNVTAIKIEDLWKEYRLGTIGHGTLTKDLESWWANVRGKEDPNARITDREAGHEHQIEGNHFWALRGIDLEIKQGETLGIIGRNGSGKSTFLKILSRVTAPTKGAIKVKGRIASLLEVGTGFHPELTGRENIFMNGAILGMSKPEIRKRIDEIIDFSGVEDFIDTPVKRYSSGMYIRLGFAVAAHLEPEILIVDEVLAVGDAEFQKKCLGKMGAIGREGRTVLFVSHIMPSVEKLCAKTIWLDNGVVRSTGLSSAIIDEYLTVLASENETTSTVTGTGEATVASIAFIDENRNSLARLRVGQDIRLQIIVEIKSPIDRLILGYGIKDKLGQIIFGTNTYLKNQPLIKVSTGEKYLFDISFPVNIGAGNYTLQTALTSSDTHLDNNYEWREEAFTFNVENIDKSHFVGCAWIDPIIKIDKL